MTVTCRVRRVLAGSIVVTVAALSLLMPLGASAASVPDPSWRCIGKVCLGQSRAAVAYKFGGIVDDVPSKEIGVPGGRVWACFWRCQGAVTEDGFTHYGGALRPANRLLTVSTCSPIVRLPDGVKQGTAIPFGDRWNGYRRIDLFEPGPRPGWEKIVRRGATKIRVVLDMDQRRVRCVYLEQAK